LRRTWLAAGLLAFTIFFYAVVYTMWLKRCDAAEHRDRRRGGGVSADDRLGRGHRAVGIEAVLMFALIFMWTPPHFWALALFMRSDYDDAGVPMLTVTHGRRATRAHVLAYTSFWCRWRLALPASSVGGPVYLAVALVLNAWFLKGAVAIWRRDEAAAEADNYGVEKRFFRFSLYYLFLHFGALLAEAALRGLGLI
jgi:heme o synthase